jgi:hypothetical protein
MGFLKYLFDVCARSGAYRKQPGRPVPRNAEIATQPCVARWAAVYATESAVVRLAAFRE